MAIGQQPPGLINVKQFGSYGAAVGSTPAVITGGGVVYRLPSEYIPLGAGLSWVGNVLTPDFNGAQDGTVTAAAFGGSGTNRTLTITRSVGDPVAANLVLPGPQEFNINGATNPTIALSGGGNAFQLIGGTNMSIATGAGTITFNSTATNDGVVTAGSATGTGGTRTVSLALSNSLPAVTFSINVEDADASATNEINVLGRVTTTNTVTATNNGGSVSVIDVDETLSGVFAAGATSVVVNAPSAGTVPTSAQIKRLYYNGQKVRDPWTNGWSWVPATRTVSHSTYVFAAGELVEVEHPRLN